MISTEEVRPYLDAVDFPAGRDEIVAQVERSGAPEPVVKAPRGMQPADYRNKDEVLRSARTRIAEDVPGEKGVKARDQKHERVAEYLRDPGDD
jgi:hypothetical protein